MFDSSVSSALLPFLSLVGCLALAMLILARGERAPVHWALASGLAALALTQFGNGLSLVAESPREVLQWRRVALIGETLMPLGWFLFSLLFARGNTQRLLREWNGVLWGVGLLTALFVGMSGSDRLFQLASPGNLQLGPSGRIYACLYLIAQVLILSNCEQTFRHADEQTRWHIKFPIVGLGLLAVYFLYQMSDLLLYSKWHADLAVISGAVSGTVTLLIGYGLLRRPMPDVQIYISRKVVLGSVTFMIVGAFLAVTALAAGFLRYSGLPGGTAISILFMLLALTGLTVVLLSTRLRQMVGRFVERHFFVHKYDYRTRWTEVTKTLGEPATMEQIASRAVQLFQGIFGAKSVSIWAAAGFEEGVWVRIGGRNVSGTDHLKEHPEIREWLDAQKEPVHLFQTACTVPAPLQAVLEPARATLIIPLRAGRSAIGWVALGPTSRGRRYGQQDQDLLQCIAAQVAYSLQHVALTNRVVMAREMEAFYEYSTFFLHDLKNFTATLSLVMQNAERHGEDHEFQQAAMRSVRATIRKMQTMMGTVAALSRDLHPKLAPTDLNALVEEVLQGLSGMAGVQLVCETQPVPLVEADRDQLHQVLLNLILNAQQAVGTEGRITIRTEAEPLGARLMVEDNGHGMDRATIAELFRPFRTKKGQGLGIGLYQCRKIIQAHRGSLEVQSEIGKGSCFSIHLRAVHEKG